MCSQALSTLPSASSPFPGLSSAGGINRINSFIDPSFHPFQGFPSPWLWNCHSPASHPAAHLLQDRYGVGKPGINSRWNRGGLHTAALPRDTFGSIPLLIMGECGGELRECLGMLGRTEERQGKPRNAELGTGLTHFPNQISSFNTSHPDIRGEFLHPLPLDQPLTKKSLDPG